MVADKWLMVVGTIAQAILWGIGYLFGFTLVMVLTVGWVIPESFDTVGRFDRPLWRCLRKDEGKVYLSAEVVSMIGWVFLSAINLVIWLA